jgi:hypothetical protein
MIRSIPLLLTLLAAPVLAQGTAQRHAFQQIPWRLSADSVRTLVAGQGFTFSGRDERGDLQFTRADGARLDAEFQDGRLAGFTMIDPTPGPGVEARYRAVADSLRAVLGEPDEVNDTDFDLTLWEAGLSSVQIEVYRHAGTPYLQLAWRGPGWYDEMSTRAGHSPQPAGFTSVSWTQFMQIAVDTTGGGPRRSGTVRGRFRVAYHQPVTPKVDGVEQDQLDAVIYEMEFDCAGRRARLIARFTYLDGRRTRDDRPDSRNWSTPQPDSHYARGMDALCRAARR